MRVLSYPRRNFRGVHSIIDVAVRPEFAVRSVTCRDDHRGWSEPEVREVHSVVLPRRGRFRRLASGVAADVDPAVGYLSVPGEEERFSHPAGGDLCTWLSLSPATWQLLAGGARSGALYVDARLDLAHRRLLTADDVDYALAEELLHLLAIALRRPAAGAGGVVAGAAREAIDTGHPAAASLLGLAELLGVSPYRLSRAFSRDFGISLTRYRNRVRVGKVLDSLEAGEESLSALAADLGFADQAHLCRTVREHLGHTPTALRRLLSSRARGRTSAPGSGR